MSHRIGPATAVLPLAPLPPRDGGYSFILDGSMDWMSMSGQLKEGSDHWAIDASMMSASSSSHEWLESDNISAAGYLDARTSTLNGSLIRRHSSQTCPSPEAELGLSPQSNTRARREAQNRAAQRAYRARKEEQIEKSRARVSELEHEVQRLRKAVASSQAAGSDEFMVLQDQLTIVEQRNSILKGEVRELKERLHRTMRALLDSDVKAVVYDGAT